jgi:hypothetical protein
VADKHVARLIGGYETTMYPTALGDLWRASTVSGQRVKLLGPQECVHYLTAAEARAAAAALTEIAAEIESGTPAASKPGPGSI